MTGRNTKRTFRIDAKATEWAFDRIQEAFENVAKDEARKLSTMQEIMTISTDYLRRIIAPVGGQGGVTMSYLCPHCNSFPIEDYVCWVSGEKKHTNCCCAIYGGKYVWRAPNRILVVETDESVSQAKVFKAHAVPQGSLGNLIKCAQVAGGPARERMVAARYRALLLTSVTPSAKRYTKALQEKTGECEMIHTKK